MGDGEGDGGEFSYVVISGVIMETREERFNNFKKELIALCKEHKVCLTTEAYECIAVYDAQNGIEDKDFLYTYLLNEL